MGSRISLTKLPGSTFEPLVSSTESITATARPCFAMVTGSARAVSISKPNPFLAFPADMTFIKAIFMAV